MPLLVAIESTLKMNKIIANDVDPHETEERKLMSLTTKVLHIIKLMGALCFKN